jgi:hypothetical protein
VRAAIQISLPSVSPLKREDEHLGETTPRVRDTRTELWRNALLCGDPQTTTPDFFHH